MSIIVYLEDVIVNHDATNPTCYLIALTGAIPRQTRIFRASSGTRSLLLCHRRTLVGWRRRTRGAMPLVAAGFERNAALRTSVQRWGSVRGVCSENGVVHAVQAEAD